MGWGLTLDPLDGQPGYPTHTNGYHYAHNHPHGYQDPLGLRPVSDADLHPGLFLGVGSEGMYVFDGRRDTVASRRYWAGYFGVSELTLAVTIEHESGWVRAFRWPWRMLDALRPSSSAGLGSIQTTTATARMRDRFDLQPHSPAAVRHGLALNDDFNIAIAAAHLRHLHDEHGLTGREAFIAYAYAEQRIMDLRDAGFVVEQLPDSVRWHSQCFSIQCIALESATARHLRSRDRRWHVLASQFAYLGER